MITKKLLYVLLIWCIATLAYTQPAYAATANSWSNPLCPEKIAKMLWKTGAATALGNGVYSITITDANYLQIAKAFAINTNQWPVYGWQDVVEYLRAYVNKATRITEFPDDSGAHVQTNLRKEFDNQPCGPDDPTGWAGERSYAPSNQWIGPFSSSIMLSSMLGTLVVIFVIVALGRRGLKQQEGLG